MKNLIFLLFPVFAFGQSDSLSNYFRSDIKLNYTDLYYHMGDTAIVEFFGDGRIDIRRVKYIRDTPQDTSDWFRVSAVETLSRYTIIDSSKLLLPLVMDAFKRHDDEVSELRSKVWIYETYYGKIKGKPYNEGDCIEMEPPNHTRTPCQPVNVKPKKQPKKT